MPRSDSTKLQALGEIFSPIIFWTLMLSLGSELIIRWSRQSSHVRVLTVVRFRVKVRAMDRFTVWIRTWTDGYPIWLSGSGQISTTWCKLPPAGLHVSCRTGSNNLPMQPVDCLTDMEPTVCAEASHQWPTVSFDVHRSRVYTMDASQKYTNEESVDTWYMNEATSE